MYNIIKNFFIELITMFWNAKYLFICYIIIFSVVGYFQRNDDFNAYNDENIRLEKVYYLGCVASTKSLPTFVDCYDLQKKNIVLIHSFNTINK